MLLVLLSVQIIISLLPTSDHSQTILDGVFPVTFFGIRKMKKATSMILRPLSPMVMKVDFLDSNVRILEEFN